MARALAGLWQAVDDLGLKLSSKKLLKLINALDEDNSGEIEYREFVKLCSMIREGPHRIVHQSEPCIATEPEYMQRGFRLGSAPVQSVCCGGRLLPPRMSFDRSVTIPTRPGVHAATRLRPRAGRLKLLSNKLARFGRGVRALGPSGPQREDTHYLSARPLDFIIHASAPWAQAPQMSDIAAALGPFK